MMTLANYGLGSSRQKDLNSAKALSKSLQIRNRAELSLKQCLKAHYRVIDEKRVEILNSIKEYYSRVPFNVVIWNKYQTKQCVIDSILLLDSKFNPYKARDAFKIVEEMLINLVYLPWHQEFRRIYTYSGQFRLKVSDPLIGIEEVLKAAGFEQKSAPSVMHLILPEDKMPQTDDGESVTGVIFDCMIAQVILTDIIDVFETCLKQSKQSDEQLMEEVNCYSWIQTYFQERCHQITDRACSNIQELLNNITNHLSKLEFSVIKSSNKNNGHDIGFASQQHGDRIDGSKSKSSDKLDSLKLSAQERTRKFLAQQSIEDENLLRLSNDLLKLPVTSGETAKTTVINHKQHRDTEEPDHRPASRPNHGESIHRPALRDGSGSFNSNSHHQQVLSNRLAPKTNETCTLSDHISIDRCDNDSMNHTDIPYNDKEPLLPRYDRKITSHQPYSVTKRNNYHENEFGGNLLSYSNGSSHQLGSGKYQYDKPYFSGSSSHQQFSSDPLRGASSRYENHSHKKYESRDLDNSRLINSRLYWSCGSCTYNNQISSEICEMCRNRKPSRL